MNNIIVKFKRYCELLDKVYNLKNIATKEEREEMDKLGYDLELNGVSDIISEMNFNKLQKAALES